VNLTRLDHQVNMIVGEQVTKALGDAAQFKSQRDLPRTYALIMTCGS
jgi:hypothetical protein